LASTLFADNTKAFDRVTGEASMNIAPFKPLVHIAAPRGTTHFKLVMGASEVNFLNGISTFDSDETAILPYDSADTAAIDLIASVTANSTLPVFQVVGVAFYQEVNGEMYPLKNGSFNALAIAKIDVA